MLNRINFSAIFVNPEVPNGSQSMKRFHKDLERAIAEIRKNITDADNDPGFKQAAEAMAQAIAYGKELESVTPYQSYLNEQERIKWMNLVGDKDVIKVTGEASKLLAEKHVEFIEKFINKGYWPSAKCNNQAILGQSYLSGYEKHWDNGMPEALAKKRDMIQSKIDAYNEAHQNTNDQRNTI